MIRNCDGRCQCCKAPLSISLAKQVHIDHCHKTGMVRGILCQQCNLLLGLANDDPSILRACIRYLEKFRKAPASGAIQ